MDKKEREVLVRKAYAEATATLRKAHKDEFDSLLHAAYEKHGVAVRKRMTAEEAAQAKAAREQVKAERAEQRRLEKIARLQPQIAELSEAEVA